MNEVPLSLRRLELGRLYFKIVDFEAAITQLEQGLNEARTGQDWDRWCQHLPLLLRIYAERMDFNSVTRLKNELAAEQAKFKPSSAINYTLGIVASYESKVDAAEVFFRDALALADETQDRTQALFGLATVAFQRKQYPEALAELHALEEELKPTLLTQLQLAAGLLTVYCHRSMGRLDLAFPLLPPMQELSKAEQNLFMSLQVLYAYGSLYQAGGDRERALQYYEMVQSLMHPRDLKHMEVQIESRIKELNENTFSGIVRLIDHSHRTLVTSDGREVELGNQFVLIGLLKLLGDAPGHHVSKEDIVHKLWKQEYHPLIHDNKIYVTVRRLRKLIEIDNSKPAYVLNSGDGYMFNPKYQFKVQS